MINLQGLFREHIEYNQQYWHDTSLFHAVEDIAQGVLDLSENHSSLLADSRAFFRENTLLGGYQQAMDGLAFLSERRHQECGDSSVICAIDGIALGALRVVGSIPFGFMQWTMQSLQSASQHGIVAGIKTFVTTPILGFWEGGKFVVNHFYQWTQGSLQHRSSFDVADEVSTTLFTAALMLTGVFRGTRGGSNFISSIKSARDSMNIVQATQSAVATPALAIPSLAGGSAIAQGFILFMSNTTKSSSSPSISEMATAVRSGSNEAMLELIARSKNGSVEALRALMEIYRDENHRSKVERPLRAQTPLELESIRSTARNNPQALEALLELGELLDNPEFFRDIDLSTLEAQAQSDVNIAYLVGRAARGGNRSARAILGKLDFNSFAASRRDLLNRVDTDNSFFDLISQAAGENLNAFNLLLELEEKTSLPKLSNTVRRGHFIFRVFETMDPTNLINQLSDSVEATNLLNVLSKLSEHRNSVALNYLRRLATTENPLRRQAITIQNQIFDEINESLGPDERGFEGITSNVAGQFAQERASPYSGVSRLPYHILELYPELEFIQQNQLIDAVLSSWLNQSLEEFTRYLGSPVRISGIPDNFIRATFERIKDRLNL